MGRRGLALLLLAVAVGALAGWSSQSPSYRSEALLQYTPYRPSPTDPCGSGLPMFEGYVDYQVVVLQSRRVTLLAMERPVWQETGEAVGPEAAPAFELRRSVTRVPLKPLVRITFEDVDPIVAQRGARALIEAYRPLAEPTNDLDERIAEAERRSEELGANEKTTREELTKSTADHGGADGLRIRHGRAVERVDTLKAELKRLRSELEEFEDGEQRGVGPTLEELKVRESKLGKHLECMTTQVRELEFVLMDVQRLATDLDDLGRKKKHMEALADQLRAQCVGTAKFELAAPATKPTQPSVDRRPVSAALGGGIAALLACIGLFVVARMRRRVA